MNFTRVVTDSGLTKAELAALYGTSRQTIYVWLAGRQPHEKIEKSRGAVIYPPWRFAAITQALVKLIKIRQLPWAALDPAVRHSRITKMTKALQGLKPAPVR